MTREELLLTITNLSVQSPGGRFRDLSLLGSKGNILLVTTADARKIVSLFRVLAGLESPLSGSIQYNGEKIGLVLAKDELPAWSKIKHELALSGKLNGLSPEVFSHLMETWDLEGTYNLPMDVLSPYEKTAFFLVLETAQAPELLLCQEPLAGLNPVQTRKMLANLESYAQSGHLIILGTVNATNYPSQFHRINLDKVQAVAPIPDDLPAFSSRLKTAPAAEDRPVPIRLAQSAPYLEPHEAPSPLNSEVSTTGLKSPDSIQPFGDRTTVTVFIQLPVSPQTDYELRRIGEIKYFQAGIGGYDIDILETDKNQLSILLAERGLTPVSAIDEAEV